MKIVSNIMLVKNFKLLEIVITTFKEESMAKSAKKAVLNR
jgi:hypothetical protein